MNSGFNNAVNLNIAGGTQFGINTGSKLTTTGSNKNPTYNAVLAVKTGDLGLAYGAGFDFGFGANHNIKLAIGFRGVRGLVNISDTNKNITTNEYYILNRYHITTYAGYAGITLAF